MPSVILLLALYVVPMICLFLLAFTDYEMGNVVIKWIGLTNFNQVLKDPVFKRSLLNTLIYVALVVPISILGGLFIALLVHARTKTRSFYEVIYFLPVTSTLIAMATVWQFLLHPKLGPINSILKLLGLPAQNFLGDPTLMIATLAAIGVWQLIGFNMILFLTGLSSIPKEIYEAASIDGVTNSIDKFLKITLPMLGPTSLFVLVTSSITGFKVFDTVAVLTQGRNQSEVLLYDIYLEGFTYSKMGYASVLTLVFLLIIVGLSAWQALHMDKKVHYA
ncbi:MAG: sugar ABC transporter permease [Alphaproteobacteria bacterium]|nr:sugar ABC transporter permease [Alphaproteobacteria bacterium]